MSTHEVKVIRIQEVKKHPQADRLELIEVEGYTCAVQAGAWKPGDLAAYIEPDYVVDTSRDVFSFLGTGLQRVKARKLRGLWSQGLLVPAPEGSQEGDNVIEALGVSRYEPPVKGEPGFRANFGPAPDEASPPPGLEFLPKYDLENWQKFQGVIRPGDYVVITEKIHGANARYVFLDGRLHIGSRARWLKPGGTSPWHRAAEQNPWIERWCVSHPGQVLFGEIFGDVQDLKYGAPEGCVRFRAFDVFDPCTLGGFLPAMETIEGGIWAPMIYAGPMPEAAELRAMAEGPSRIELADHNREGIVIKPWMEKIDPRLGRVALKLVSNWYLAR